MKTNNISNLTDYLAMMSADTPYQAGRHLYKYTDCGPWTNFVVQVTPAHTRTPLFAVGLVKGSLAVVYRGENINPDDDVTERDLSLFGFNPDGTVRNEDKLGRTLKGYREKVMAFIASGKNVGGDKPMRNSVLPNHPDSDSGPPDRRRVWITVSQDVPAETRSVYYVSDEANTMFTDCVGVEIGSIVEGSEAEIGPDYLAFPFTREKFDEVVNGINDEACFYWKRDNLDTYHLRFKGKDYYFDYDGEESLKDIPKSIRRKVMEFVNSEAGAPMSGSLNGPDEDGDMTPIPGTKATIERMDKSDFTY
jgi:hypothetical protein